MCEGGAGGSGTTHKLSDPLLRDILSCSLAPLVPKPLVQAEGAAAQAWPFPLPGVLLAPPEGAGLWMWC